VIGNITINTIILTMIKIWGRTYCK